MFYTLTINGFAYSFMPYTFSLYVIITLFIVLLFYNKGTLGVPNFLICFALYIFLIDLIFGAGFGAGLIQSTLFCLIMLICFIKVLGRRYDGALSQLPLCFAVTTIFLSIAYLTHREQYVLYSVGGMDRIGWTDPNYFGMVLGMGTTIGLTKVFDVEWKGFDFIDKIIYIATIVVSVPVLILNASRGAILSVIVCAVVILMFSKTKIIYKVLTVLLAVFFVIYLYNNQYFDMLESRLLELEDDQTGSGRTIIWQNKLTAFSSGNPLKIIFGYSHIGGSNITGRTVGFHNDFVGCLVDYGIIGLCFLLYMLYYPIKIISKSVQSRQTVIVLIIYLATCFMTLEPFLTGILPYFTFYLYALLIAKKYQKTL